MYKLVLFPIIIVFVFMLYAYQIDQELAMQTLFRSKYAVNRSVHAAAQQTDMNLLVSGTYAIDSDRARDTALEYLQNNLNLDTSNKPLSDSFLQAEVKILEFQVINHDEIFPYAYSREEYDYSVILERPGVVMIVAVQYPRIYNIIRPIEWKVKGASELVH
jgi:hypothetical protein